MHRSFNAVTYPSTRELAAPLPRTTDDCDDLIGHTLAGSYKVIEPVGEGAYGRVYRAEQVALRRDVAIKVLEPSLARVPAFAERFCREAFAASRVHHPNAVGIIDFGSDGEERLFLAMEYVPGWTLRELIRRASPLSLPRVIDIMAQLLMGMEAIHEAGIIHADLKTANVMIEELRNGEIIKVVDFGIARLRDPEHDAWPSSTLCAMQALARDSREDSSLHHISGTPGYIAPEVIRGGGPTCQCDVYAAGVIMYQLLTGRAPFPGQSAREVLSRQIAGEFVLPSALRPDVSTALDMVVSSAMASDPTERFASVTGFRRALEAAALQIAPGALPYCLCEQMCLPSRCKIACCDRCPR